MKTRFSFFISLILSIVALNAQLKVASNGSLSTSYGTGAYANLNLGNNGATASNGTVWGKWAFEIWGENLNIWKPWPSANNGECNYYMFLTPSGAIGIGKVPTHQTEICLDVNGKVYSYGIELTSDERLKKEIQPLTNKVDKLYLLAGKSYKKYTSETEIALPDIKDEKGNLIKKYEKSTRNTNAKAEFGFLAQELMEVYPELVSKDSLGYYNVNYIGLIPVLVEALKNQKAEIEALKQSFANTTPKKISAASSQSVTDALTYPVLDQNSPNPFSSTTTISYYLPATTTIAAIYVYDMNGTQLKSYPITQKEKGNIVINGREFNAGMYLYALIVDGKVIDTKRMILTK